MVVYRCQQPTDGSHSQPKSVGLVCKLMVAAAKSAFLAWIEWTLAMALPWWQHYKHYFFFTLGTYNPEGDKKMKSKYKIGYDHQSVQSVAGKLQCKRTALKRCTKIETLWYRKLVSRASPVFSEILLPRSSRRWRADALKRPRSLPQLAQRCNEHHYYYYVILTSYCVFTVHLFQS